MKQLFLISILSTFVSVSTVAEDIKDNDEAEDKSAFGYTQLRGDQIMDAYINKTMEGIYASYAEEVAQDLPPETFTEFHHDNATTTYEHRGRERKFTTIGIYTVKKDRLCYVYNDPGNVVGRYCFYVFKNDNCYFHYHDSMPVPTTAEDFDNWTSMAYAREDRNSCLPDIS